MSSQPLVSQVYGNDSSYTYFIHSLINSEWIWTLVLQTIFVVSKLLTNVRCITERFVHLPNSSTAIVSCVGVARLNRHITLHNVLFILEFHFKFVIISALTHDTNCFACFANDSCVLQDKIQGLTIGKGSKRNVLYFFTLEPITIYFVLLTPTTWHTRLRHPSYTRLLTLR